MQITRKEIVINLQVEGVHRWEDCDIEEVYFLRDYHRHIFHIEVRKEVSHNDREIEIIMLKRDIIFHLNLNWGYNGSLFFDNMSCEDIAEWIYKRFECSYVKVLEDNENGAIVC
jgi:hypothetical protein